MRNASTKFTADSEMQTPPVAGGAARSKARVSIFRKKKPAPDLVRGRAPVLR
jgi:hypothetical protein